MVRRVLVLATIGFLMSVLQGCQQPTELIVVIKTNIPVGTATGQLSVVKLLIDGPTAFAKDTGQVPVSANDFPLLHTLRFADDASALGPVEITVEGQTLMPNPQLVVSRTIDTDFVEGESRKVQITLFQECNQRGTTIPDCTPDSPETPTHCTIDDGGTLGCVAERLRGTCLPRFTGDLNDDTTTICNMEPPP